MPELPEVETVRRALQPIMQGARIERVIVRRPNLRVPFPPRFAARLEGSVVHDLARRAKYLLVHLSSGETLIIHLGMSGSFRVAAAPESTRERGGTVATDAFHYTRGDRSPHDHVSFVLADGVTVTFNDPRRFGSMDLVETGDLQAHRGLAALGPEPLDPRFTAVDLARACRGRTTSLKAALMDQRIVAGLGNIYASEALHRARLSPRRRARTIAGADGAPREVAAKLVGAIKRVLQDAVNRAAASSSQAAQLAGESAPERFRVYDREGLRCRRTGCAGLVRRITQAGRSTFFCPRCQR